MLVACAAVTAASDSESNGVSPRVRTGLPELIEKLRFVKPIPPRFGSTIAEAGASRPTRGRRGPAKSIEHRRTAAPVGIAATASNVAGELGVKKKRGYVQCGAGRYAQLPGKSGAEPGPAWFKMGDIVDDMLAEQLPDGRSVVAVYEHKAASYDSSSRRLLAIGFRDAHYRRRAVESLKLRRGDTVVEIGCGTGQNFDMLQAAVGPSGRIVGVDVTGAMLERARERARGNHWTNVELIQSDALGYEFPERIDGVLATFSLSFVPECAEVVERGSRALAPGRRWAIADQEVPAFGRFITLLLFVAFTRSFGVTRRMMRRRPWEATRAAMESSLANVSWRHYYLGFVFVASGEKPE